MEAAPVMQQKGLVNTLTQWRGYINTEGPTAGVDGQQSATSEFHRGSGSPKTDMQVSSAGIPYFM